MRLLFRSKIGRAGWGDMRIRGVLAGAAVICALPGPLAPSPAAAAGSYTAYVTSYSGGTVTPVSTATGNPGSPVAVGAGPRAIAITPDGRAAYVANSAASTVTPVFTATGSAGTPIPVGSSPVAVAITPDGRAAYVVNSTSNTVTPISTPTNTPGAPIHVGLSPSAIAITPDGRTAYVTNSASNSVTPINLATNAPGSAIAVGWSPAGIAITPDGGTAYVSNSASGTVTPIALASNSAGPSIGVGFNPAGVAVSPDGRTAYVADSGSGTVTPINVATNTARPALPAGSGPQSLAVTPDGANTFVAGTGSGLVNLIAPAASLAGWLLGGGTPHAVAITPDQAPGASFTVAVRPAGSPSSFDASSSTVLYGTITNYHWSFGDGSSADTATPTTSHVYAAADSYMVTLTETDSAGTSTTDAFTGQTMSRNGLPSAQASHAVSVPARPSGPSAYPAGRAAVVLPHGPVMVSRDGYATITVSCPASARRGCSGRITLRLARSARFKRHANRRSVRAQASRCGRGCRPLGSATYQARAGQKVRVRVRIASYGRRLLAHRKAVRVTVIAQRVAGGRTTTSRATITLKAARRAA
jgi:YVTN family beta-propeller protein